MADLNNLPASFLEMHTFPPPHSTHRNVDGAIDDEIAQLKAAIVAYEQKILESKQRIISWTAHKNARASIARLPEDILLEIWSYLTSTPPWIIRITHVCAHWRRVALAAPTLWSTPAVHGPPEAAAAMLRRAEAVPLTLVLDLGRLVKPVARCVPTVRFVNANLQRTRRLVLWDTLPGGALQKVGRLGLEMGQGVGELRVLEVRAPGVAPYYSGLARMLLGRGCAPGLRALVLENRTVFRVPGDVPELERLTTLEVVIGMEEGAGVQQASVAQVVQVLGKMRALRKVRLDNVFREAAADAEADGLGESVHLGSLEELSVNAGSYSARRFFDCISYPATTKVLVGGLWKEESHQPLGHQDTISGLVKTLISHQLATPVHHTLALKETGGVYEIEFYANPEERSPLLTFITPPIPSLIDDLPGISRTGGGLEV